MVSVPCRRGAILGPRGYWRWKAPRLSGKRCPSRGDVGTRASVESCGRRDHPALRSKTRRRNRGARVARTRRGTFTLVILRQQAARGEVLRSGLLGPCNPALSFNGHRRKRWSDRGVARKRRRDRTVAFRVALRCELAAQRGRSWRGCHGSQPSRSFLERGRPSRRKKARRERGRVRGHRRRGTLGWGEKRLLESVSVRRKWSCRSRWASTWSREALTGISREHREASGGQGRGSSA